MSGTADGTAGDSVTVIVTDDGPGIPADVGMRVFERLYTGRDGPGRAIGTGLGLAIVRELSVAMGGTARRPHQRRRQPVRRHRPERRGGAVARAARQACQERGSSRFGR